MRAEFFFVVEKKYFMIEYSKYSLNIMFVIKQ